MNKQRLMELAGVSTNSVQLNENDHPSLDQAIEYLAQALVPYAQEAFEQYKKKLGPEGIKDEVLDEIELIEHGNLNEYHTSLGYAIAKMIDNDNEKTDMVSKIVIRTMYGLI